MRLPKFLHAKKIRSVKVVERIRVSCAPRPHPAEDDVGKAAHLRNRSWNLNDDLLAFDIAGRSCNVRGGRERGLIGCLGISVSYFICHAGKARTWNMYVS